MTMPRRSERTPAFLALAGTVVPLMATVSRIRLHHADRLPPTGAFVLPDFEPTFTMGSPIKPKRQ